MCWIPSPIEERRHSPLQTVSGSKSENQRWSGQHQICVRFSVHLVASSRRLWPPKPSQSTRPIGIGTQYSKSSRGKQTFGADAVTASTRTLPYTEMWMYRAIEQRSVWKEESENIRNSMSDPKTGVDVWTDEDKGEKNILLKHYWRLF